MKNTFLKKYKTIIKELSEFDGQTPQINPELCIAYITDALDRYQGGWQLEECSPNSWGTYVCKDSKLCVRYIVEGDSTNSTFTMKLLNIGYKYGKGTYGGKEYLDLVDAASNNPDAILWKFTVNLNEQFGEMLANRYSSDNCYISKIMMSQILSNFSCETGSEEKMKALPMKEIKTINSLVVYLYNGSSSYFSSKAKEPWKYSSFYSGRDYKPFKTNVLLSIPDGDPDVIVNEDAEEEKESDIDISMLLSFLEENGFSLKRFNGVDSTGHRDVIKGIKESKADSYKFSFEIMLLLDEEQRGKIIRTSFKMFLKFMDGDCILCPEDLEGYFRYGYKPFNDRIFSGYPCQDFNLKDLEDFKKEFNEFKEESKGDLEWMLNHLTRSEWEYLNRPSPGSLKYSQWKRGTWKMATQDEVINDPIFD